MPNGIDGGKVAKSNLEQEQATNASLRETNKSPTEQSDRHQRRRESIVAAVSLWALVIIVGLAAESVLAGVATMAIATFLYQVAFRLRNWQ